MFNFTIISRALLLLLLVTSSLSSIGQSQSSSIKKIYMHMGMGPSSKQGFQTSIGLNTVLKSNWCLGIDYKNATMNAKNLPGDYQRGSVLIFFIPIPDRMPNQEMQMISLTAGRFIPLSRTTWLRVEGGISMVDGYEFSFTKQAVDSDGWSYTSSNYNTQKEKASTIGGSIKADFTWGFCSFAGLGVGLFAEPNSIQSPVGGSFKLILGWMNRAAKKKKYYDG